ncbi:hypothetical protein FA15DRAFT_473711 [Coprinopsis marcescibilis]|uniref:Uncharacterized protein n=1 Tax=Coprinopsis marcescibilis TaxID=230819 RepID=A0A5C3KSM9_COPMA|nr:hypothetical protein FA15DRAFT_473711 [Coprinopsis marcescibilis]
MPAGGSFAAASEDPLYYTRASGQWFASPTLPDDFHHIYFEFSDFAPVQLLLDFAVVAGGELDTYDGSTNIIVDDDTVQEIFYWGDWARNTLGPADGQTSEHALTNYPFRNGTRRTRTVGSGFRFRFLGTSIRIYAASNRGRVGSYDTTFAIDGEPPRVATYTVTAAEAGSQSSSTSEDPHTLLFQYASLEPVEHILTANLTNLVGDQVFIFDYLVYTPAFSNLNSKPVWQVSELDPALGRLPNSSGGETSGKGPSQPLNVAALAGGLVGGVFAIAVCGLVIFIFILKRRRRQEEMQQQQELQNLSDGMFGTDIGPATFQYETPRALYSSPFENTVQASPEGHAPHWIGGDRKRPAGQDAQSSVSYTNSTYPTHSDSASGQGSSILPPHHATSPIFVKSSADPAFNQQMVYPNSGLPPTYFESVPR